MTKNALQDLKTVKPYQRLWFLIQVQKQYTSSYPMLEINNIVLVPTVGTRELDHF